VRGKEKNKDLCELSYNSPTVVRVDGNGDSGGGKISLKAVPCKTMKDTECRPITGLTND
jgi:hypothetical protein